MISEHVYVCQCCGAHITHTCAYTNTMWSTTVYYGGNTYYGRSEPWPPLRDRLPSKVVHFGFGQIPEVVRTKKQHLRLAPRSLRLSPRRVRARPRRHRPLRSRPGCRR